jgi:Right handed beta helix region
MKLILILLAAVAIATIAPMGSTSAATYYVDKAHAKASDSNPGTEALPWATIQKAAATLIAGDTVYVKAGTYKGQVTPKYSGSVSKYITYSAYPGHEKKVIIDGDKIYIKSKSYIVVNGFRIQNSYFGIDVMGPNGSNIIVSNNYTYNTTGGGIHVFGVSPAVDPAGYDYKGLTNITIKDNEIERACNGGTGQMLAVANGVDVFTISGNHIFNGYNNVKGGEGIDAGRAVSNGKIVGNNLHNLNRISIYIDGSFGDSSSHTPGPTYNIEISNNTVHDTAAGITVRTEGRGPIQNVKLYNNLIWNIADGQGPSGISISTGGQWSANPGKVTNINVINNTIYNTQSGGLYITNKLADRVTVRNNITWKTAANRLSGPTNLTVDSNLFDKDPLFTAPDQANLYPKAGSLAIDKGSSVSAPSTDVMGTARPQQSIFDIGAYEYVQ